MLSPTQATRLGASFASAWASHEEARAQITRKVEDTDFLFMIAPWLGGLGVGSKMHQASEPNCRYSTTKPMLCE
jgi:hypothetical protein